MAITLLIVCVCLSQLCYGKSLDQSNESGIRIIETDILIPPENDTKNPNNFYYYKRNAQRDRNFLWRSKVIPFEISSDLSYDKDLILKALKTIENVSCITFKQQDNEMIWVKFVQGQRCASFVGKQYWSAGPQEIFLGPGCMVEHLIIHEVFHALGFWHEQSRPDRDQNIEILWENILNGKEHNFDKFDTFQLDYLGTPYDIKSVMQYGNYYFSKNGLKTMASLKDFSQELGSKSGLSVLDIVRLNALYSCADEKRQYVSSWSDYSPCDGQCIKTRQRFCSTSDLTKCPNADGNGIETETKDCVKDATECYAPVNGHWGRWSPWNECSTTCGLGTAKRVRMCINPVPQYGGAQCVGSDVDTGPCDVASCDSGEVGCNFERGGFCQWTNIPSKWYDFKWHVRQGTTRTAGTGPTGDADGILEGHYAYVESSSPATEGDVALLVSPQFSSLPGLCLWFSYHMFGDSGMGKLNVYKKDDKDPHDLIWQVEGNQGNKWLNKTVDITSTHNTFNVVIEAIRGSTFKSDIAIDNLMIVKEPCIKEVWIHKQIGCFDSYFQNNHSKIFPIYEDLRPKIIWTNLNLTIESCAGLVKSSLGHQATTMMFGIEFYGECWYGINDPYVTNYLLPSTSCILGVGKTHTIMLYRLKKEIISAF